MLDGIMGVPSLQPSVCTSPLHPLGLFAPSSPPQLSVQAECARSSEAGLQRQVAMLEEQLREASSAVDAARAERSKLQVGEGNSGFPFFKSDSRFSAVFCALVVSRLILGCLLPT